MKRGRDRGVCRLPFAMRKVRDKSGPDAAIARIAGNQHGVVTAVQLASAGLSPAGITRRLAAGRLHPVHRGVYAVGHRRLSDRGRWMAAVLAGGDGAVLSHLSAAELWGIHRPVRRPSEAGRGEVPDVHVTVPRTGGVRKRNGIVLHRSSTLIAHHCTRHDNIPVTTPARTLSDIRALISPARFQRHSGRRSSSSSRLTRISTRTALAPTSSTPCSPSATATAFPAPR
jgi:predicted transcriptional regulator of viral defense system